MLTLRVQNLQKSYTTPTGERSMVLDIPSFDVETGAHVALAGGSGSGKTTLLNLVAGILRADAGSIELAGQDITVMNESQRDRHRAEHIGYVFQTFNLLQGYSVLENIELGMAFGAGVDRPFALALLRRVGLDNRIHYKPRQLSVGQQQRVAVTRALANKPKLVLADEPTGSLDTRNAAAALRLIRELCTENGAALLLVSHDRSILDQFETVHQLTDLNRAAAQEVRS
jgi:ABC-type lipoprotein export system ATPase subunit